MAGEMPEKIMLSGAPEEERWRLVMSILQDINNGLQAMKSDIAGLVRDQREAVREHSRLEDDVISLQKDLAVLRQRVSELEKHRDDVNITVRNAKFLLGGSSLAGIVAWFKSLGGHL